jgi:hypothetical protein
MPIPLLLWGAAAALAATGVVKGVQASTNFDKAKEIGKDAERNYNQATETLDADRSATQKALETLGALKVDIFTDQIKYLVEAIKKGKSKITGFDVIISTDQLKEYEGLVLGSLAIEQGLGSGAVGGALAAMGAYGAVGTLATASTGTAIAGLSGVAATNATLAWLGGGALSAGGFGMAGGMIALGGIVLGPALAIGGFMMASKAEEALSQAHAYNAKVDVAVAEMKIVSTTLKGIRTNAAEMHNTLVEVAKRFDAVKVPDATDSRKFERMIMIGKKLKEALDIPIIKNDGTAIAGLQHTCSGILNVVGTEAA